MSWFPHIYIQHCTVDEPQLRRLSTIRGGLPQDPEWMVQARRWAAPVTSNNAAILRSEQFVKVGYTYRKDPHDRTSALHRPSTTMECFGIPVVPIGEPTYIPGEYSLEQTLHERWAHSRIDPDREFFWMNGEIRDLQRRYSPRPVHRNKWGQEIKTGGRIS
jgi:hypothetical protein